jgi:hypothetical protein
MQEHKAFKNKQTMKMPGFRLPKNQQFNYKPRYWDPKEEERLERQQRADLLKEGGVEAMKTRISTTFQRSSGGSGGLNRGTYRNRQVAKSNFVLVAIIGVLLLLCYLGMTIYLPQLEQMLS